MKEEWGLFYFVAVIFAAHFFMPPEYHWTRNTVSELAAQGLKYQWIMQVGFIGFGLLLNVGIVSKFISARKIFYPDLLIMIYGLAILHTIFLIFVIGISITFGLAENGIIHLGRGLIQRMLYLVSFVWLLFAQVLG